MSCSSYFPSMSSSPQVAPLLCIPVATGRPSRALGLPAEAFSGARRELCHLRSRVEEVCREEVDRIGRAGTAGDPPTRSCTDIIHNKRCKDVGLSSSE